MAQRVSREHIEQVLVRLGIATDEREAMLDQLRYPADVNEVMQKLGLSRDQLTSTIGGSP
jgi:hypothetical protein